MEEAINWLVQAKKDLKAAKNSINSGDYEWASFQAHQCAEKSLKAVYISKYKELLKIHDLVLLARKINAPQDLIIICSKVNPVYLDARYPDIPKKYTIEEAQEIVNATQKILEWTEKNL